jgi:hypothetical protein
MMAVEVTMNQTLKTRRQVPTEESELPTRLVSDEDQPHLPTKTTVQDLQVIKRSRKSDIRHKKALLAKKKLGRENFDQISTKCFF